MIVLENEFLRVSVNKKGAELASVYDKQSGLEHMWQAGQDVWEWHAPNLFPVVGGCLDDKIKIGSREYPMKRHGFARHSVFTVLEATGKYAEFSLTYNDAILEVYPFRFQFQVLYHLSGKQLRITYKVINEDQQTIYFSVGGHPAFNVPFRQAERLEDYYIQFEHAGPLETHLLSPEGFFTGETETVELQNGKLMLTPGLFADGALIFKNSSSKKVTLGSINHNKYIELSYPHFPYIALWAKDGVPFICIEPWFGCADTAGRSADFTEKEGVRKLEQGHVFEADYTIMIADA